MHEFQEAGVELTIPEMQEQREAFMRLRAERQRALIDAERGVDFSVVDPETGIVLRSGHSQFQDLAAQAGEGEIVIEGKVPDDTHMVAFGADGLEVIERPPPPVTPEDVRSSCRRRILSAYSIEDQLNAPYEGTEAEIRQWIEAMRERCAELIGMEPIPQDYDTDKRWPQSPPSAYRGDDE